MSAKYHKVNGNLLSVDITEVNKQQTKWINFIMVHLNYDNILLEIASKNILAAKCLTELKSKLTRTSPFVEYKQNVLAVNLKATEANVSTAIKYLLNYEPNILTRVKSGVFAINPNLAWKCSIPDRHLWEVFIRIEGYEKAYEVHKAGLILEYFKSIESRGLTNDYRN